MCSTTRKYIIPQYKDKKAAMENEIEELINLDPSKPSKLLSNNELPARWNIARTKLFQDESEMTPVSKIQKLKEHVSPLEVEFLCEKLKRMSPKVQFLGERSNRDVAYSPEVQLWGERVFKSSCNDMAKRSEKLYNAGLTLGSSTISTGKENVPPKRVVKPSYFIRSPFENNTRSLIEPHEMIIYETITTLCDDPDYRDRSIINMNNCRVSLEQFGSSMKQDGWVGAWVINACRRKIFKDNHPRFSNTHFFFHTLAEYFLEKWPSDYMKNVWNNNVIKNFKAADSAKKLHQFKG